MKKYKWYKLFKYTKTLTGEYMDLLELTFKKSISKTPYRIQ